MNGTIFYSKHSDKLNEIPTNNRIIFFYKYFETILKKLIIGPWSRLNKLSQKKKEINFEIPQDFQLFTFDNPRNFTGFPVQPKEITRSWCQNINSFAWSRKDYNGKPTFWQFLLISLFFDICIFFNYGNRLKFCWNFIRTWRNIETIILFWKKNLFPISVDSKWILTYVIKTN